MPRVHGHLLARHHSGHAERRHEGEGPGMGHQRRRHPAVGEEERRVGEIQIHQLPARSLKDTARDQRRGHHAQVVGSRAHGVDGEHLPRAPRQRRRRVPAGRDPVHVQGPSGIVGLVQPGGPP